MLASPGPTSWTQDEPNTHRATDNDRRPIIGLRSPISESDLEPSVGWPRKIKVYRSDSRMGATADVDWSVIRSYESGGSALRFRSHDAR